MDYTKIFYDYLNKTEDYFIEKEDEEGLNLVLSFRKIVEAQLKAELEAQRLKAELSLQQNRILRDIYRW